MIKKLLIVAFSALLICGNVYASSTVTASARLFTSANSEYLSATDDAWNSPTGSWYQAGWVKLTTNATQALMLCKYGTGGNLAFEAYYNNATSKFGMVNSHDGTNTVGVEFGSTSTTGVWYFLEYGYDATNQINFININRGSEATAAQINGQFDSTGQLRWGAFYTGAFYANAAAGPMIWTSGIPTSGERDALYNSGNGVFYRDAPSFSTATVIAAYDFVETSGTAYDASGNGRHLTDNNTVTSAAGKVTYTAEDASDFESSTSEYLSLANANIGTLNPGDTDFTARCWIKAESLSGVTAIMGIWIAASGNWLIYTNGTTLNFTVQNSSGTNGTGTYSGAATATWYCIHATHDAANNEVKLFINGAQSGAAGSVTGGPRDAGSEPFYFGRDGIGRYFDGIIAGGAFWTRELSDAEILTDYNRGFGQDYQGLQDNSLTTGLYTYWPLDEASGTRVNQTATANKDLTDNNTVTGNPGVVYDEPEASNRRIFIISEAEKEPVYA